MAFISWLWGSHSVNFESAANSVSLPVKKIEQHDETSTVKDIDVSVGKASSITLAELCKKLTPPCNLNPFLFNGHLQTIATVFKKRDVPVHYRRHVFESTNEHYPGHFAVDFVSHTPVEKADVTLHPRSSYYSEQEFAALEKGSDDDKPMLVTLHGLSGGSHELYVREVIEPLVRLGASIAEAEDETRWEACVINSRGCARSTITSQILFNARATWDIRQTVKWLRKLYPNRPLFAIGFSLGANILINYLGEEGAECEFSAAVVVSCPWDLLLASSVLQSTWMGKEVYSKAMGTNMKKLFNKHVEQLSKHEGLKLEAIQKIVYLHEFDRAVQCPTWGYPTENAYYRDASCIDLSNSIRIPTFILHALDDPVTARDALPIQEIKMNPYLFLCTTSTGGHLAWYEFSGKKWFVKPVSNYLRAMAEKIDLKALREQPVSVNTHGPSAGPIPATFEPIRRRLHFKQ